MIRRRSRWKTTHSRRRRKSDPEVSPDGRYIVFTSNRSGSPNIWRMDIDGSNPKQITNGKWDYHSSCSPDGKWLVYIRESSGKRTLWRVSIDGYDAEQLSDQNALYPAISPDGKLIAFSSSYGKVTIISSEGGQALKTLDIPRAARDNPAFLWTPDGRALTYHVNREGADNIWSQPLDGSPAKQVTDFKSDEIFSFAWSRHGDLAIARGGKTSDVVLITNSK